MTPAALRSARVALGLTQTELAARLGAHELTVSAWEQGRHPIPGSVALALGSLTPVEGRETDRAGRVQR